MSDCENVWLAIRIGWWVFGLASAGASLFFAGYQRGRRTQAETPRAPR